MSEQISNILTGGFIKGGLSFTGVVIVIALWVLFRKAGEKGWKAIVPFLNGHVLYRMIWRPVWFWVTLALGGIVGLCAERKADGSITLTQSLTIIVCSVVLFILGVTALVKLARSFGRGFLFVIGLVVFFPLFILILALGRSRYIGPSGIEQGQDKIVIH